MAYFRLEDGLLQSFAPGVSRGFRKVEVTFSCT